MLILARCGCAGGASCSCIVQAGANVTVTGNGSPGLPYIVSASSTGLTVSDTTTVSLSLVAEALSAAVRLDPTAGNLITVTASGLRLDCAAIAACASTTHLAVVDTGTIDLTLTGDGSIGTPYTISGVVKADGTAGAKVTGSGVAVKISADSCNSLTYGGDGGVFVPAASTSQTSTTSGSTSPGSTPVPAGITVIDTMNVSITNPSLCRSANVMLNYMANVTYTLGAGNGIVVTLNGMDMLVDESAAGKTGVTIPVMVSIPGSLAPGATASFPQDISVRQAGTAGATYSATNWVVTYLLVTA